jgi:DNA-binding FrmR family transcriptional regulator
LVEADVDRAQVVIRIAGIIKILRAVGAEVSCLHVSHCAKHRAEHGREAGTAAAGDLAEAIRNLVESWPTPSD